jgi:hypothetical protein
MFGVLGVGNYKLQGKFRDTFYTGSPRSLSDEAPGYEYEMIGMLAGNFIQCVRLSMGDGAIIGAAEFLDTPTEGIMFWLIWLLNVIIQCIIFMNFIVAEAGNTYNTVSEQLECFIEVQKAALIAEAERMIPGVSKTADRFPRAIIVRTIET